MARIYCLLVLASLFLRLGNPVSVVTVPFSNFVQNATIRLPVTEAGLSAPYTVVFSELCPSSVFSISSSTGYLVVVQNNQSRLQAQTPRCVLNVTSTKDYVQTLQTFYCLILSGQFQKLSLSVVINISPSASSCDIVFPQYFSSTALEGLSRFPTAAPVASSLLARPSYFALPSVSASKFSVQTYVVRCDAYPIIVTSRALNRTQLGAEQFTLGAGGVGSCTAYCNVSVQVVGANSYAPVFTTAASIVHVREDVALGTEVARFLATDLDVGINGQVVYWLASAPTNFYLNPYTGSLTVGLSLYNTSSSQPVVLTIMASDLGYPPQVARTLITIFTDSVNKFPPVIHILSNASIIEGVQTGTVFATIQITDRDSNVTGLTLSTFDCSCFQLSTDLGNHTYNIVVSGPVDVDSFPAGYSLTLLAYDNGQPTLNSSLTINVPVLEANEQPIFNQSSYLPTIVEEVPIGTFLTSQLKVVDTDGQLVYSFSSINPNWFSISSKTGTIFSSARINYEASPVAVMTVQVQSSQGGPIGTCSVVASVIDINDNPPLFSNSNYNITILESVSNSVPIFNFAARDNDSKCYGAIQYSILYSEPDVFTVDSVTGQVFVSSSTVINYATFQSARLSVSAVDLGPSSYTAVSTLNVSISKVYNIAPVINPFSCPCWITENRAGLSCPPITAYDPDSPTLLFKIKAGNNVGLFAINNSTGVVTNLVPLDREQQSSYVLGIAAFDGTLDSAVVQLKIVVVDENDCAPSFSGPISLTAPQDLAVGDVVGSVAAIHPDAGYNGITIHQFAVGTPTSVTNAIYLNPTTGELRKLSSPLPSSASFTVVASDLLLPVLQSSSTTVTLTTVGYKNRPPAFYVSMDKILVPDNQPVATPVYVLNAIDPDTGTNGQLTYSLVTSTTSAFSLSSSGVLTLQKSLSGTAGSIFTLNASVVDGGNPPLVAYQLIVVMVYSSSTVVGGSVLLHNAATGVCHANGSVIETPPGGTFVVTLSPTQSLRPITYTIVDGNFVNAFALNGTTIIVADASSYVFDRTQREALYLVVRAQYQSNFHFCAVTVVVNDINDHGPTFSDGPYALELYAGLPAKAAIFQLKATDLDIGSNAVPVYSLVNASSPIFAVDAVTGYITLTSSLSTMQSQYTITVRAADVWMPSMSSTTQVMVTVIPTANSPPSILPPAPGVSPFETVPVNSTIFSFTFSDIDLGVEGRDVFCIASGNNLGFLQINPSGSLQNVLPLDYDIQPAPFNLTIAAYDYSPNVAFAMTTIQVSILNQDNGYPFFRTTRYRTCVAEGQSAGTQVLTVQAYNTGKILGGQTRYSINDTTVPFAVSPSTGAISTTSPLNREYLNLYTFDVTATYLSSFGVSRSSSVTVEVTVLDINDNAPVLYPASPSFVMFPETTQGGTLLTTLSGTDADIGTNGMLGFYIAGGSNATAFSLDPLSGSIRLTRKLDYETDPTSYSLVFRLSDFGTPSLTSTMTTTLTFQLQNVVDSYPQFSSSTYTCTLTNGLFNPPCFVSATTSESSGTVQYSVADGTVFSVGSSSGQIQVVSTLAPSIKLYPLMVGAANSLATTYISRALVLISVTVTNTNAPLFENAPLSFRVPENLPNNTAAFFIHASYGSAGAVTYSRISANGSFGVNPSSGAVYVTGQLNYESSGGVYSITVAATNPNTNAQQPGTYTIAISDVNENTMAPFFTDTTPREALVFVDSAVGTTVANITALDYDPTPDGVVTYVILGGSGYGYFAINPATGALTTNFNLTSFGPSKLTLTVAARDNGFKPMQSICNVTLILANSTDAKPFFTAPVTVVSVPEGPDNVGSVIAMVTAYTSDSIDPSVSYTITSGDTFFRHFSIDNSSGVVSTLLELNYQQQSVYSLVISASHPNAANSQATTVTLVVINVSDVNSMPQFATNINFTAFVFQNFPVSASVPVMRVFALDFDTGNNSLLTYSIASPSGVPFGIDPRSGYVFLTSSLNASLVSRYAVPIQVVDQGSPPLSQSTTVQIVVVPPASPSATSPTCSSASTVVSVTENTPLGTLVATYAAQVSDARVLMYSIQSSTPINPPFSIQVTTGMLYIISPVRYAASTSYTLMLGVSDGANSITCPFTVNVIDINDNRPQFTAVDFRFAAVEHSAPGTVLGQIVATDSDAGTNGMITYSIIDAANPLSLGLFGITSSGFLKVSADIDREILTIHTLTVAATDGGTPPLANYTRVVVQVVDINDHIPTFVFPIPDIFVPEDAATDSAVFTINAFDPDSGNNAVIVFSLQQSSGIPFSLNPSTGSLIVTTPLDYESSTGYNLVISASNPGSPNLNSTARFRVNILDVLDSGPNITGPSMTAIIEGVEPYIFVAQFTSTDFQAVQYRIAAGNTANSFIIDPAGVMRTQVSLDRENIASYLLTVQASYYTGYSTNVSLAITVTDVNDNSPIFSSPHFAISVAEDAPTSTPVYHFNISDADSGTNGQVSAFVISDPIAANYFSVSVGGDLSLRSSLYGATAFSSIRFDLYVFDSGFPRLCSKATVDLAVVAANHPPVFSQLNYQVDLSIPVLVKVPVYTVQAVDGDSGTNGQIRYSLIGGNGTGIFAVILNTGDIVVINNFNLIGVYQLVVLATDGGGKTAMSTLFVTAKACGFTNLAFHPQQLLTTVTENNAINITLPVQFSPFTFNKQGSFVYSLPLQNPCFAIDPSSGNITALCSFDREQQPQFSMPVHLKDLNDSSRLAQADVLVAIGDLNDNAPQFTNAPYIAYLLKTTPLGTAILQINATDMDVGTNAQVTYFLSGDPYSVFAIDPSTGTVRVNGSLANPLLGSTVVLSILARDGGTPPLSSQTTLTVGIVDPAAPQFSASVYTASVLERAPTGYVVVNTSASSTTGNTLYYSLSGASLLIPFTIDLYTGQVTLNALGLSYRTTQLYRLTVQATDSVTPSLVGLAVLEVSVAYVNTFAPQFSMQLYQGSILEGSSPLTTVVSVTATDPDPSPNTKITYGLSDSVNQLFQIDSATGDIITLAPLDYEVSPTYLFTVFAADNGVPPLTGSALVRVYVINANDEPPVFSAAIYNGTVPENTAVGTIVLQVQATDLDGFSVTYSSSGSPYFTVNSYGQVLVSRALVNLTAYHFELNVSAFDGLHYGFATVVVDLSPVNAHSPMFLQQTWTGQVVDRSPPGIPVLTVTAYDSDRGSYGVVSYTSTSSTFPVDPVTGLISTNGTIDRLTTPVISFAVFAQDGGGRTSASIVTLTVLSVNVHAPTFDSFDYIASVPNGASADTPVFTVHATDPDLGSNGTVTYSFCPPGNQYSDFYINLMSGLISSVGTLYYSVTPSYVLCVMATDLGTPPLSSAPKNVSVIINQAENVPMFSQSSYNVSVFENSTIGTQVFSLSANVDPCDAYSYTLLAGSTPLPFAIQSGAIVVSGALFRSAFPTTFAVQLQCDQLSSDFVTVITSRAYAAVTISLVRVNQPPVFPPRRNFVGNVTERLPAGTVIKGRADFPLIQATDPDTGPEGTITYSIVQPPFVPFVINATGIIYTTQSLDRNINVTYTFRVIARDNGSPPLTSTSTIPVTIFVLAMDGPPVFPRSMYNASVPESAPINTNVITMVAIDTNNPPYGVVQYSLASGGSAFAIDQSSGTVTTVAALDRETTPSYVLYVQATDGPFSNATTLIVYVTDVNDNPPVFQSSSYETSVDEGYPTGVPFLTVTATDADVGTNAQFVYSIVEIGKGVTVNSSNGAISFVASPDYQLTPVIQFSVSATDVAPPYFVGLTQVTVNIIPGNDNWPVFSSPNYTASVGQNLPPNTFVTVVLATDKDAGSNGFVTYSTTGAAASYFSVQPSSGAIVTTQTLSRRANASFVLTVIASDHGNVSHSTSVLVYITVLGGNDNAPAFPRPYFNISIPETVPGGYAILNTQAVDEDTGVYGQVVYTLQGGAGTFSLLQGFSNGSVQVLLSPGQQLNPRITPSYALLLVATDGGMPPLSGNTTIFLVVLDTINNPPVFSLPIYYATWPASVAVGTTLVKVQASDVDPSDNGRLVYFVQDATKSLYPELSLNNVTGAIVVVRALNYFSTRSYNFPVYARDQRAANPQTATSTVQITLTDANQHAPVFIPANQTLYITENNDPGTLLRQMVITDLDAVTPIASATFSISSGDDDHNFSITADSGFLAAVSSLDREVLFSKTGTSQFVLVITANDNGDPPLTGTSYITVVVVDQDDNHPVGTKENALIYLYKNAVSANSLGVPAVIDPDVVNYYSYTLLSATLASGTDASGVFGLDVYGNITFSPSQPPPVGQYMLRIEIKDNTILGLFSAVSSVYVTVSDISDSTVRNSVKLFIKYAGSSTDFVSRDLTAFVSALSSLLGYYHHEVLDVQLFTVMPPQQLSGSAANSTLQLSLAVRLPRGNHLNPTLVQHILFTNAVPTRYLLIPAGITIKGVWQELCVPEPCSTGNTCGYFSTFSPNTGTLGSGATKLIGITSATTAACTSVSASCGTTIPCPSPGYCLRDKDNLATCASSCSPNPCRWGGVCVPQRPEGYFCMCPKGYDGENCELTSATFTGASYTMFPSIIQRKGGTLYLDVITDSKDGLLLFSGRFDTLANDHIAVGVEAGLAFISLSYGGEKMKLLNTKVSINDRSWHTLIIQYSETVLTLAVLSLDPYSRVASNLSISGQFQSLDLGAPTFIGGIPPGSGYSQQYNVFTPFVGCVRNVRINGELMDFASSLLSENVTNWCSYTDIHCQPNPCAHDGKCLGSWESYDCSCNPRYSETTCSSNALSGTFEGKGFISYMAVSSIKRQVVLQGKAQTFISLNLLTSAKSGTVLQLGDPALTEYAMLEIVDGYLQFRYNLGSGQAIVLQQTALLSDGEFHVVSVQLTEQSAELLVDNMYVSRNTSPGPEATLDISTGDIYVGALVGKDGTFSNAFVGCIWGLKLDRHDLPLGGMTSYFTSSIQYAGTISVCPEVIRILGPDESRKSSFWVYTIMAAGLFLLLVIGILFSVFCSIINHCRQRNKTMRTDGDVYPPEGSDQHTPGRPQLQSNIPMENISSHNLPPPPPMSVTSSRTWSEATFTFNNPSHDELANEANLPASQPNLTAYNGAAAKGSQTRRELPSSQPDLSSFPSSKLPLNNSKKDLPRFSQPNLSSSLSIVKYPLDDEQQSSVSKSQLHLPLARTPSGHQSIQTTVTENTAELASTVRHEEEEEEEEVARFVQQKVMAANNIVENQSFDKCLPFSFEGQYEPMGSIGSLYDILPRSSSRDSTQPHVIPPQQSNTQQVHRGRAETAQRRGSGSQRQLLLTASEEQLHPQPAEPHAQLANSRTQLTKSERQLNSNSPSAEPTFKDDDFSKTNRHLSESEQYLIKPQRKPNVPEKINLEDPQRPFVNAERPKQHLHSQTVAQQGPANPRAQAAHHPPPIAQKPHATQRPPVAPRPPKAAPPAAGQTRAPFARAHSQTPITNLEEQLEKTLAGFRDLTASDSHDGMDDDDTDSHRSRLI